MKKKYLLILLFALLLIACEDSLERFPADQLTVPTTFTNNSNFEIYAWGFYDAFIGYSSRDVLNQEARCDLALYNTSTQPNSWLHQLITVPSSSSTWNNAYARIKSINLMLDNIEGATSKLTDKEKAHWKSVGLFFRAYEYINLVNIYGAVPWVDKVLTDSDEEYLYGERTPRDEVAKNILDDLTWAEEHINANGNGENTVNRDVVRALITRFGLREGTWRKYHSLGGETPYLQASFEASKALVTDHPTIIDDYQYVFNSEDLAGKPGILLYKAYIPIKMRHYLSHHTGSSIGNWDVTKKGMDIYLCTDGQTRWTSPLFAGDKDPYDEFRNRDHRLYYTVLPPYRVNASGKTYTKLADIKVNEYIDLMDEISTYEQKTLPNCNWAGNVLKVSPHFRKYNEGQGFNATATGYWLYKFQNRISQGFQNSDVHDAPLFRMGEVMLNYAEAAFELGEFTQAVADATVNKLRARGHVAALSISAIPDDPTRDATVEPALWEIRRERAVELMYEGFRTDDLRRWKKWGEYTKEAKLGRWVVNSEYGNKLPIQNGADEGYVQPYAAPEGVPDHYYLSPIPSDQIVLNPQLKQNPGWSSIP
ncbi:RagB/SusD family nutrient uptake outer membrane protein [Saccharicrinis sp. GN24d3]|uniref:RagB/SusD family nutrient uptake outer membrane protein n=1 Tax=Saccharicrinis sp. GN24d3 TaxID=3458416 RepID=UPI004035F2E8